MARRIKFRARKRINLLPFLRMNVDLTRLKVTSWTWHLGPLSWNTRSRDTTLDTPGPGSVTVGPDRPARTRKGRRS